MKYLQVYLVMMFFYVILDISWVGFIAKSFYYVRLQHLLSPNVNWIAVILFYFIFISGLLAFVVNPFYKETTFIYILYAAAFGLTTYSTFNLVNLALLNNWSIIVTIVDCCWGMFISTVVCLAGRWALIL
jgi:uncharacterized membrane protein